MTTEKTLEHLGKLQDYYAKHRAFPSYKRLAAVLGLASTSAVSWVLTRLEKSGHLARNADGVWVPAARFHERKIADMPVRAGLPVAIENAGLDPFLIDEYLVDEPSSTLMIPVRGDSMKDAGILDGDIAIVERRDQAKARDLVVAIVDREFTLKILAQEDGQYVLRPANADYPVIRPKGELRIHGVVRGIVRKYRF